MTELVNIAEALTRQARAQPDSVALVVPTRRVDGRWQDRRYTYRQLDDLSDRLAAGLQAQGYEPGTRVAFMVPPSLEFFALFFALFKAGLVPVLIDPGIGMKPLKACLAEARPRVFIGVARAQWARLLLGWGRESIRSTITIGPRPFALGRKYKDLLSGNATDFRPPGFEGDEAADRPAAILFTSGSTGIPKGVVYRHRNFVAQVRLMRETFGMSPGEVDLPTFPPFALFDPALGMTTVIPKMDFTRPAKADPDMLVSMIEQYGVTNLFGSPALMNTLSRHLEANRIKLPTLKRALSAGAPVPPKVVERVLGALNPTADLHTPYGATEVLPVATVAGRELLDGLADAHREGRGICVGRPLAVNTVRIIKITDRPIEKLADSARVDRGEIGEICVCGPTVTEAYWQRDAQTRLAKMADPDGAVWHRMGDLGWIDDDGRLWYCGRKSERVITADGTLYTECIEGRVNAVHGVFRSALVGVGEPGRQIPVVIVEPEPTVKPGPVIASVHDQLEMHAETAMIRDVLMRQDLPTDIRHNAKIRRAQLAEWAARRLRRRRIGATAKDWS